MNFKWRLSPESRYVPFYRRRRREESHSEKSAIRNRQSEIEMGLVTSTPTSQTGRTCPRIPHSAFRIPHWQLVSPKSDEGGWELFS
jgi:hypothetical protein